MMPHNALCHRKFEKSTIDLSVVDKSSENSSPTNESSEKRCLTQIMRAPKGGREGGSAPKSVSQPKEGGQQKKIPSCLSLACPAGGVQLPALIKFSAWDGC